MTVISKLGIGPMSSEIIEAVYQYSSIYSYPLMLIASKNQIDWSGGYVNNWNTRDFSAFTRGLKKKYKKSNVYLCRDHCGPGFNGKNSLKDTYKTIDFDIESGFDLIHVDFSNLKGGLEKKMKLSKEAINYILSQNNDIYLEIGTDKNTGKNIREIKKIEYEMKYFSKFVNPQFYVCQTGSLIKEVNQVGEFNSEYVKRLKKVADRYNMRLKEHNADYLGAEDIIKRKGLVSALNIAPMFGVIQTSLLIQKCFLYGIDPSAFLEVSYKSRKWEKWLYKSSSKNYFLCSLIAGHYNFSTVEYNNIVKKLERHERFKETVICEVMKAIDLYVKYL